jgi:hypothetical protein
MVLYPEMVTEFKENYIGRTDEFYYCFNQGIVQICKSRIIILPIISWENTTHYIMVVFLHQLLFNPSGVLPVRVGAMLLASSSFPLSSCPFSSTW